MKIPNTILYVGLFIISLIFSRHFSQELFHPIFQVNPIDQSKLENIYQEPPIEQQINFYLILVDPDRQPQLMGVWWVAIAPQSPITFMAVFPQYSENEYLSPHLDTQFRIENGKLVPRKFSASFLENIQSLNLPANGFIVLDQTGLAILVDFLGGVDLNNQKMDGKHVLDNFVNPSENSKVALKYQTALWDQICQKALFAGSSENFEIVRPELARHSIISSDFPLSFPIFQSHITNQENLTCRVNPTRMK